jgi:hypothetical protein
VTILRIEVCQVCQVIGKPIEKYRVGDAEHLFRLPLCSDCTQRPLAELLAMRPARRTLAANKPTTLEEVMARKKTTRKKPPRVAKKRG